MITAYTDGGARGNPGPAGYGVHIVDSEGATLAELVGPLGRATNNVAEYSGLIAALQWALDHQHGHLHVRMDSELVIRQMRGEYKVKHAGLQALHARARSLMSRLERVTFEHVRREQNTVADRLSNAAMDLVEGKVPSEARDVARPEPAAPLPTATSAAAAAARPPRAPRGAVPALPTTPGRFRFDDE